MHNGRYFWLLGVGLLACGKPSDVTETSVGEGTFQFTSSGAGDESLGMGVTGATIPDTDPSMPTASVGEVDTGVDVTPPTISDVTTDVGSEGNEASSDVTVSTSTSTSTTTTESSTFPPETTDPNCPDPQGQPQDAQCTDSSGCGCASGNCFLVPILGGWCGECLVDGDCPGGGCTVPDPLGSVGAVCNTGQKGDGCMSSAVCNDPTADVCGVVLDVPGITTVATCGECDGGGCGQGEGCAPVYDIGHFTGVKECVPEGSVPNDGGCEPDSDGAVCDSGFCGTATIMGLVKVGICGECNENADCPMGQTCSDPVVDLDQGVLVGSVCE